MDTDSKGISVQGIEFNRPVAVANHAPDTDTLGEVVGDVGAGMRTESRRRPFTNIRAGVGRRIERVGLLERDVRHQVLRGVEPGRTTKQTV